MRLLPSEPDVQTIVGRINRNDLDLQPDFQRGEVWSLEKRKKLIDSILRNWHVPPIHVVEVEGERQEVLDGQQRLVAIRDFADNKFSVDGTIEPPDPDIQALDGLRYRDLPPQWKRRVDQFTIRFFKIVDYRPEEPGELFFRLNQMTSLTTAEQRNAFYGATRDQIKSLLSTFHEAGIGSDSLGFTNSRMAYEDVLARYCAAVEEGSLEHKITADLLASYYRRAQGFSSDTLDRARTAIQRFGEMRKNSASGIRFNKATLFSWLVVCGRLPANLDPLSGGQFLSYFEDLRAKVRAGAEDNPFVKLYSDRATSRVADVSSVLIRDFVIWFEFWRFSSQQHLALESTPETNEIFRTAPTFFIQPVEPDLEVFLTDFLAERHWGRLR